MLTVSKRKQVRLSREETAVVDRLAAMDDTSRSAIATRWLELLVKTGESGIESEESRDQKLQILAPAELLADAEAILAAEGHTMQDYILARIRAVR